MSYRYDLTGDRIEEDEDERPALAGRQRCEHNRPLAADGGRCDRCATAGGRYRRLRRGDLRRLVEDARARGEAS